MQAGDLAFFRELLSQQLEDLLDKAQKTVGMMVRSEGQTADLLDRATLDSEQSYTWRIRDRESRLIRKIKIALSKIEDGTFGICEACEEEISRQRLLARPVTAYCIRCKSRMEEVERLAG